MKIIEIFYFCSYSIFKVWRAFYKAAHLGLVLPEFKCPLATCGWWLPYWIEQLYTLGV